MIHIKKWLRLEGYALLAFLLSGVLFLATPANASPATLSFTPSATTVDTGDSFTVQLRMNTNSTAVSAMVIDFSYQTNLLTLTGMTDGSEFTYFPGSGIDQFTDSSGTVRMFRFDTTPSAHSDVLIATLNFTALSNAGSAALSFISSTEIGATSGANIYQASPSTTITIEDNGSGPTADLVDDGIFNALDIGYFFSLFTASDPLADFTGEGSFNALDIGYFFNLFSAGQ